MTEVLVELPPSRHAALGWVAEVVLDEWLALPVRIVPSEEGVVTLAHEGRVLRLASFFPDLAAPHASALRRGRKSRARRGQPLPRNGFACVPRRVPVPLNCR